MMGDWLPCCGAVAYAALYCLLRWTIFPRLVYQYPNLCHGSELTAEQKERTAAAARVSSHASSILSTRVMGIVMAVLVSALGFYVVWETRDDVLWSRSELLIPAARFLCGYFIVDILSMYQVSKWSYSDTTVTARLSHLLRNKALFIVHHLFLMLFGLTILSSEFRGGKGDWLIGVVCLFELSTVFLSVHYIQRQVGTTDTVCYQINAVLFLVVYFIFRIISLPFVYLMYAWQHHNGNMWQAIASMRLVCHVVVLLGFVLFFYWFLQAVDKVASSAKKIYRHPRRHQIFISSTVQ